MKNYDEIDALNWSTLKHMETSPAWVKHLSDHPEEQKDKVSFRRGRAIHVATLEPEKFDDVYTVMPDFGDMRSSKNRAKRDEFLEMTGDDVEVITQEERYTAMRCADAVQKHPVAREYLKDAKTEQAITWNRHGVACKGRVDAVNNRIVDLKSTRHFDLRSVTRDAWNFRYHAQLAWYHTGAYLNGLVSPKVYPAAIFVAQSPSTSFVDVAVLDMERYKDTFDAGVKYVDGLLDLYIGCKSANWWPGMAPDVVPWELPDFMKVK